MFFVTNCILTPLKQFFALLQLHAFPEFQRVNKMRKGILTPYLKLEAIHMQLIHRKNLNIAHDKKKSGYTTSLTIFHTALPTAELVKKKTLKNLIACY